MPAAGCEVVVCEAQCEAGSVIRLLDPSLHPSEVCGPTAGPIRPTAATSPLPLPGWDDSGEEEEEWGEGLLWVVHQMWLVCKSVCLSVYLCGWNVLYIQYMDGEVF